jgi:hypothetical protein
MTGEHGDDEDDDVGLRLMPPQGGREKRGLRLRALPAGATEHHLRATDEGRSATAV